MNGPPLVLPAIVLRIDNIRDARPRAAVAADFEGTLGVKAELGRPRERIGTN